ncbi:MAG TPA: tetratricopeptide repeat protein [Deltaproteobacteria bacterium]|nr:tetratricopeptide repeat protein [Deltaproteobacteria bacterium]
MYSQIILFFIIVLITSFFYLHSLNPQEVVFNLTKDWSIVLPVTVLLFCGLFVGLALVVFNTIFVDLRRFFKGMRSRRAEKLRQQCSENYRAGVEELYRGNTKRARALLEKALEINPDDVDIKLRLVDVYKAERRPQEAFKLLESGLARRPGSLELLMAVALTADEFGDVYKAAATYEEILKIDEDHYLALTRLRDIRTDEGKWEEAARLQKALLDQDHRGTPLEDEAVLEKEKRRLAGLLYEWAQELAASDRQDEALDTLKEILRLDDTFLPAYVLQSDINVAQGNVSQALKILEGAFEKHHRAILFLRLEDVFIKESNPEKILEKYRKAIERKPHNTELRLLLSRLYLRLEMVDEAIEELERIANEWEDTYYGRVLLGEAYMRRNQNEKAAQSFHRAIGIDKELLPPFVCSGCGARNDRWEARCPSCGDWNTLVMNKVKLAPAAKPAEKAEYART